MSREPFLAALTALLGAGRALTAEADRIVYGADNSRRFALPLAVALPEAPEEVAELVRLARAHRVPITARGRATATTGAAVPAPDGLVISFERMNATLAIDPAERLAVVAPGVLNAELQTAAAGHGLFWPPDPSSAGYATVGGNLACNAGGPRTLRYGQAREHTLALAAVDGQGRAFRCGAPVRKRASGYELARLLVGSEGTLALFTEATLALSPLPEARRPLAALYRDPAAAVAAVIRVLAAPARPAALEFLDPEALALARAHGGAAPGPPGALLLLEAEGSATAIGAECEALARALAGEGLLALARDAEAEELWDARRRLSPALRHAASGKINEDVVLPLRELPGFIEFLASLSARHGLRVVVFGHVGDGNLHVNLLYEAEDPAACARAEAAAAELMAEVPRRRGALSGEHGIGLAKRPFLAAALDPVTLELWRGLKRLFDPDGLLNPGKLLPD